MWKFIFWTCAAMVGLTCLAGCKERSVEMGPVETIEAFYKAMTVGEWAEAKALCDTISMKEYIATYEKAFNELQDREHDVMTIARSIITDTEIRILDTEKDDKKRCVTYVLKTDGYSKTRKATLKKEDGEWRVEKIADAH